MYVSLVFTKVVLPYLALPCLVSPIALYSREQGKPRQASKYVPVDSC